MCPLKREAREFVIELGSPGGVLGNTKTDRVVAGVAVLAGRHVPGRLAQRDSAIVATLALHRNVIVLLIDVAGLAAEPAVRTVGRDAGGFVVIFVLFIVCRRYRDGPNEEGQQQK